MRARWTCLHPCWPRVPRSTGTHWPRSRYRSFGFRPVAVCRWGGYLSHWAGGFYLDSLDHLVTRTLKPGGYLRYMDDFVLFADRPETLDVCRARIIDWLDIERGLRLKVADAPALDNRQPGVFLGFRISRGGIGPGPKALKRLRRRLRRGDDLNPAHLARSLAAFRGMWRALG
jgi:hypothetical protein